MTVEERIFPLRTLTPDEKAAVDVTLDLWKGTTDRFFRRRDLSWKISLSVWAALLLAANLLATEDVEIATWKGLAAGGAVVGLHAWWALNVIAGERRDHPRGHALDKLIRQSVGLAPEPPEEVTRARKLLFDISIKWGIIHLLQLAVTLVLVVLVIAVAQ